MFNPRSGLIKSNLINGIMVNVLALSAVDRGFEPRSGKARGYNIGMCCFSAKHASLRVKTGWFGISLMCLSGATCLSADCCFSEIAL